jgi:hypothetical protein
MILSDGVVLVEFRKFVSRLGFASAEFAIQTGAVIGDRSPIPG